MIRADDDYSLTMIACTYDLNDSICIGYEFFCSGNQLLINIFVVVNGKHNCFDYVAWKKLAGRLIMTSSYVIPSLFFDLTLSFSLGGG